MLNKYDDKKAKILEDNIMSAVYNSAEVNKTLNEWME